MMMSSIRAILWRLVHFASRSKSESSLERELELHLQMEIEKNIRCGMDADEARRHALIALGGLDQTRQIYRETLGIQWLDGFWQDLQYAIRRSGKHRSFSLVAVLVLTLGIGANTAIFSIVNSILFRRLPVSNPSGLMYLYSSVGAGVADSISLRDYLFLLEQKDPFIDLLAHVSKRSILNAEGDSEQVNGEVVTANYFTLLGVKPFAGRTFLPAEEEASQTQQVIVISHRLWRSRFNSNPGILGKNIELNDQDFAIIGIMAPDFDGISDPWQPSQYWVPLRLRVSGSGDGDMRFGNENSLSVYVIGRLRPGVTAKQAKTIILVRGKQLQQAYHQKEPNFSLALFDSRKIVLPFDPTGEVVPNRLAAVLMVVAGIVLFIAAANLAGILMARGVLRWGEMAIRLALGASRWRIMRQFLIESILLSTIGGTFGILLALCLLSLFEASTPNQFGFRMTSRVLFDVPIDIRVLIFTALVSIGSGVVIGLAPGTRASRTDVVAAIQGGGIVAPGQLRSRLRFWIVLPQVCLSIGLLIAASGFVKTVIKTELADPGYDADNAVVLDIDLPPRGAPPRSLADLKQHAERLKQFNRRVIEKARVMPEIANVSVTNSLPMFPVHMLSWANSRENFSKGEQPKKIAQAMVTPDYFSTMGIQLLRGRNFNARESISSTGVVIICEALARQLWPGEDPLGRYLAFSGPESKSTPRWLEVIGIVKRQRPVLSEGAVDPVAYVSLDQQNLPLALFLVARGYGNPRHLISGLRRVIMDADAGARIYRNRTVKEEIGEILYPRRMATTILSLSALIGLLLASLGIYGVVSHSVAQRIREIAIRAALGAQKIDILKLVLREGVMVTFTGFILGLLLAWAATRTASSLVVALPSIDLLTCTSVLLIIATIILLACYIPARRATRVEPMAALRDL
jgi:predicted permease